MALHLSSISAGHTAERAVARTPAVGRASTEVLLAQKALAQTVAAAKAPSVTSASTAKPAASNATTTATATTSTSSGSSAAPTAESVFGSNPWDANPTGSGPTGSFSYNPYYFATAQTAATVASMVGGQVVATQAVGGPSGSPFVPDQLNEMVKLANGALINPGLVASFYTHGYPQSMVDQMVANEVANVSKGT